MCMEIVTRPHHCWGMSSGYSTALSGQLAVEFWKLGFHWNADGASQEVNLAWRRAPLLQKTREESAEEEKEERKDGDREEEIQDR